MNRLLLILTLFASPLPAANWRVGSTLIGYDSVYLFGNSNSPFSTLINLYPPNPDTSAGIVWHDPKDASHYYDFTQDVFSRRDWLCFHDSLIGQDVLKIGLGGSAYPGNFQFGVGDLDPSIQVRVYDVGKPQIQWSVLALSQNNGFRSDSVSKFFDGFTVKRGFADGGAWFHSQRGNDTTGWRFGHGLDSQGSGDDFVFYNPNRRFAATPSSPGVEAFRITAAGSIAASGIVIHSNSPSSFPPLAPGDVFLWSSNGVPYVIYSCQPGSLTTNKLAP